MNILREAIAGTLESNDVLVRVSPAVDLNIQIDSIVITQFGGQIRQAVLESAQALGVRGAAIVLEDRGALTCTIKARVETALMRAGEERA
ncbi:MAG: citrate lyase acyl carrier protein [Christensenellales bacterium]